MSAMSSSHFSRFLYLRETVAREGTPAGDSWGKLPNLLRAGGDTWITGSYDPALDLIYWGVAQAKPWMRAIRNTNDKALYTSSTLALKPADGSLAWYFQHVPGESLAARLKRQGAFEAEEARTLLAGVCDGLAYAHKQGVVHRDIKPDNVLLSGGTAVVTDFGIAKAISAARTSAPGATSPGATTPSSAAWTRSPPAGSSGRPSARPPRRTRGATTSAPRTSCRCSTCPRTGCGRSSVSGSGTSW